MYTIDNNLLQELKQLNLPIKRFKFLSEAEKNSVVNYLKEEEKKLSLLTEQEEKKGRSELAKKVSMWAHTASDAVEVLLTLFGGPAGALAAGALSGLQAIAYYLERDSLREDEGLDIWGLKLSPESLNTINITLSAIGVVPAVGNLVKNAKTPFFGALKFISKTGKVPTVDDNTVKAMNFFAKNYKSAATYITKSLNAVKSFLSKSYLGRILLPKLPIDEVAQAVTKGAEDLGAVSQKVMGRIKKPATATAKVGRQLSPEEIAKVTAKAAKEGAEAIPDEAVKSVFKLSLSGTKSQGAIKALRYLLFKNSKSWYMLGYRGAIHLIGLTSFSTPYLCFMAYKAFKRRKVMYALYKGQVVNLNTPNMFKQFFNFFFKSKGVVNPEAAVNAGINAAETGAKTVKSVPTKGPKVNAKVLFKPFPNFFFEASKYAPATMLLKDIYQLSIDSGEISLDDLIIITEDSAILDQQANAIETPIKKDITTPELEINSNRIELDKANFAHQQGFNYIFDCAKSQVEKIDKATGNAVAIYKKNSTGWWAWTQTGALVSRTMNAEIKRIEALCGGKKTNPTQTTTLPQTPPREPITPIKPIQRIDPTISPIQPSTVDNTINLNPLDRPSAQPIANPKRRNRRVN